MANFQDTTKKSSSFTPAPTGEYDALLFGIVFLELQSRPPYDGQEKPPAYMVKFIFEVPEELRENGDTHTLTKTVTLTTSDRGNLIKDVSALIGKQQTSADLVKMLTSDSPLKELLGSAATITVKEFTSASGYNGTFISELVKLHSRVPKPDATREHVYFDPTNPDLAVFEELTKHTREQVMSALNSSDFPVELHKAHVRLQESEAAKAGDKKVDVQVTEQVGEKIDKSSSDYAAIQ